MKRENHGYGDKHLQGSAEYHCTAEGTTDSMNLRVVSETTLVMAQFLVVYFLQYVEDAGVRILRFV